MLKKECIDELTLQEIQEGSFLVLLKLKEIFDNHNWKFYLTYGTLIGAVRHKGFIPWDDDIDVWVPRKDYNEFIEYYLNNKDEFDFYQLHHARTNKKYPYGIARFSDSRYKIDYQGIKDYGLGLFVDLYPLDEIDINDKKYIKKQKRDVCYIMFFGGTPSKKWKQIIKVFLKTIFLLSKRKLHFSSCIKNVDKRAQVFNNKIGKYLSVNVWDEINSKPVLKSDVYGEETFLEFNGVEFRVPSNYDKLLRQEYGDYMKLPPEEERIGHHYYKAYKINK